MPTWEGKNTSTWTYEFSNLPVFDADSNMYYYKAKETSGKGWPEGAKATFKLTSKADLAKDDIKFVNTVEEKKKDITRTGDEAPLGVLFGGLGIGMAGLAVLLEDRKRRNRNK